MNHASRTARPATLQPLDAEPRKLTQLPRYFRWFSDHCVLRQIDASDVSRIWSAVLHPAFERCWTVAIPHSQDEVAKLVAQGNADWQRGTRYTMAVLRKQTQEFVGWVEARSNEQAGAWLLDWFVHPRFLTDELAQEAIGAAADLMFKALNAQTIYANCPRNAAHFEKLLNEAGFIELVPAGSLDVTGKPRPQALYELGRRDWSAIRGMAQADAPVTLPKLELQLL